jgi:4-amino-4-deoxy-L-arabinose transferase-like glycosyltransferase
MAPASVLANKLERLTAPPSIARVALLSFAAVILFSSFATALSSNDTALHAGIARHMAETGRWGTPTLYGAPWFEHLPPFLWLAALSFELFGFSAAAARLPFLALALITVLATFEIGRRKSGEVAGFAAGIALVTTEPFWRYAGRVRPDVALTCFVALAILFLERAREIHRERGSSSRALLAFGLSTGLAIFFKGPMALAAVCALVVVLIVDRRLVSGPADPRIWGTIAAMIAVPAPWVIYQLAVNGGAWFDRFILHQVLWLPLHDRSAPHDWLMVPRVLFRIYWPWIAIALLGLLRILRGGRAEIERFAAILAALGFVVFVLTASVRQTEYYLLPAYPMLAVLAGHEIGQWIRSERAKRWIPIATLPLSLLLFVVLFISPIEIRRGLLEKETEQVEAIAPSVRQALERPGAELGIFGFNRDRVIWTLLLYLDLEKAPDYFEDAESAARFLEGPNHVLLIEDGTRPKVEHASPNPLHEAARAGGLSLLQGAPDSQ